MSVRTVTSLAFAAACMTAIAIAPGAQAQSANPNGPYGSTYQNQMPPSPQTNGDWSRGGNGSASTNYTPQSYQGNMAPSSVGTGGEQVVTNGPQSSGVERSGGWSSRRNVIESEHYSRLVQSNPRFRAQRMRKECGPITDAQLHAQCIDSFNQPDGEPSVGSSTGPQNYSTGNGQ